MASSLQRYTKLQGDVLGVIKRLGTPIPCVLRQVGTDYPCYAVFDTFNALEYMGGLAGPLDTKVYIAAKGMTAPMRAGFDKLQLITFVPRTNPPQEDVRYRIVKRPEPLAPGGIVMYWLTTVRQF